MATCAICNAPFVPKRKNALYCPNCKGKGRKAVDNPTGALMEKTCSFCGKPFLTRRKYRGGTCPECVRKQKQHKGLQTPLDKYIITGYDPDLVRDWEEQDDVLALKGRMLDKAMMRDFIDYLPAGTYLKHGDKNLMVDKGHTLVEIEAW